MKYRCTCSHRCTSSCHGGFVSGDTIHHAFDLPVFGKNGSTPSGDKSEIQTMKASLQLRWFIIDETSMVSARLLADIDTTLRSFARAVDPYVTDATTTRATICGSQYFV